jgi:hypothetical protein
MYRPQGCSKLENADKLLAPYLKDILCYKEKRSILHV